MKKDINHKEINVPVTFNNVVYYIMYWIVFYIIRHGLCQNVGKFKRGDKVKYNWKAKYQIPSIYNERKNMIREIDCILDFKKSKSQSCEFKPLKDECYVDGCDVFWLRKIYWWEKAHKIKRIYCLMFGHKRQLTFVNTGFSKFDKDECIRCGDCQYKNVKIKYTSRNHGTE